VLVLDGPTGSELEARGFVSHATLWTAAAATSAPELLASIHRDYLGAGAELLTANTFRTTAFSAKQAGLPVQTARHWAQAAVAVARGVASPAGRWVLGSLAPLADCYRPEDTPADAVLASEHAETADWLVEFGCDGILVETQGCGREARIAVTAARRAGALPVLVSFLPDSTGTRLLNGEDLIGCAEACLTAGAAAVLVNCAHSEVLARSLAYLRRLGSAVPLGAYPNAARLLRDAGHLSWQADPSFVRGDVKEQCRLLSEAGREFRSAGAHLIGACCGFSPIHLAALAAAMKESG
jgi:S-methylmethionine-dependent homocysteine/selenocysteine methylase